MDFLQSHIWRTIQECVGRDIFEIHVGSQTYRGVTRTRRVGPLRFRWHQVLGVSLEHLPEVRRIIKRDFSGWGDVFFQVGVVDQVATFPLSDKKTYDVSHLREMRTGMLASSLAQGWHVSWKENMPLATIRTGPQSGDALLASFHKEHRRYYRKAQKAGYVFQEAKTRKEQDSFYHIRSSMASSKGLGVMSYDSFVSVMDYLTGEGVGGLYVLMDGDQVVAGSIVVYREDAVYYLYGASNRDYANTGAHILLQHSIMVQAHDDGYLWFDHWGVASLDSDGHGLSGVTRFKDRFGGEQIECVGNLDMIHNSLIYRLMKKRKA